MPRKRIGPSATASRNSLEAIFITRTGQLVCLLWVISGHHLIRSLRHGQVYLLLLPTGAKIFPRRIGEDVAMETPAIAEDRLRRLGVECCRAKPLIGGLEVIAVEIEEPTIARDWRVQLL